VIISYCTAVGLRLRPKWCLPCASQSVACRVQTSPRSQEQSSGRTSLRPPALCRWAAAAWWVLGCRGGANVGKRGSRMIALQMNGHEAKPASPALRYRSRRADWLSARCRPSSCSASESSPTPGPACQSSSRPCAQSCRRRGAPPPGSPRARSAPCTLIDRPPFLRTPTRRVSVLFVVNWRWFGAYTRPSALPYSSPCIIECKPLRDKRKHDHALIRMLLQPFSLSQERHFTLLQNGCAAVLPGVRAGFGAALGYECGVSRNNEASMTSKNLLVESCLETSRLACSPSVKPRAGHKRITV